jgi:hypothetical protein
MFASISIAGPQPFNDWFDPDTVQRMQLGIVVEAVDPYWGGGTFLYGIAGEALAKGNLVNYTEVWSFIKLPSTANMGRPFGVVMAPMAINEFGWIQVAGRVAASSSADVAADAAAGIGTAGNVGANSAGKQLLGYRSRIANAGTVAITNVQTTNNSAILRTKGYDGWFLGMALSGTGVPASTVVAKLDPDGRTVYMGSAVGTVDKLATATGSVTVTGTYTGFVGALLAWPHTQGAIT